MDLCKNLIIQKKGVKGTERVKVTTWKYRVKLMFSIDRLYSNKLISERGYYWSNLVFPSQEISFSVSCHLFLLLGEIQDYTLLEVIQHNSRLVLV